MSSERSSLAPGQLVGGRFRLDVPLGRGAMGSVWRAWHTTLNVQVAVKFIDTELSSRSELRSRFEQEAQSVAMIDSPHVVRVLDYGINEGHRPYIAMDLLRGTSLGDRLQHEPVLPTGLIARVVMHAAKGLSKAHRLGIVHRDIKPENLFLCDDEDEGVIVKILDFGIAKSLSIQGKAHQTGTGHLMGTPHYMSPEQALGNKQVDHRSDLYSLAVVAYRCLTGRVPFDSEGLGALIVGITMQPHTPVSVLRPDLPSVLDPWFATALAKNPQERFQTAKELAKAFVDLCRNLDQHTTISHVPSHPLPTLGSWNDTTGVRRSMPSDGGAAAAAQGELAAVRGASVVDPREAAPPALRRGNTAVLPTEGQPDRGPTLQGAAAAALEPEPSIPMRRSAASWIALASLLVGGTLGTVWWLNSAKKAPGVAGLVAPVSAGLPLAPPLDASTSDDAAPGAAADAGPEAAVAAKPERTREARPKVAAPSRPRSEPKGESRTGATKAPAPATESPAPATKSPAPATKSPSTPAVSETRSPPAATAAPKEDKYGL